MVAQRTTTSFGSFEGLAGQFHDLVVQLVQTEGVVRVADVGGGANPLLSLEEIGRLGLDYTVVDIDAGELDKAPLGYGRLLADVTAPPGGVGDFDLVVSRMLAEHITDPAAFHRGVHALLRPGGSAAHVFPTLWSLPFLANRVLPNRLADRVLAVVRPRDRHRHAKFPAYYRWCHGPTERQHRRLERTGFSVTSYVGLFGHGYYRRVPGLAAVHRRAARAMTARPVARWTSYAMVVLRRA